MAEIDIPVPGTGNTNGDCDMAADFGDRYAELVLQNGIREQTSAGLYADDARRAAQRRTDEMSIQEALATQTATTSQVAKDAMQLQTAAGVPK